MKVNRAPIMEGLLEFNQQDPVRFHVPGHKGQAILSAEHKPYFAPMLRLDVTEVGELDDLHHPQGMIAEAQRLAAEAFFADQSYFLVNGSTVGNMAMLFAVLERGDQVLVQRNSHKSVFNSLALLEVEAVLIEPTICPTFHVPIGLTKLEVKAALELYPQAKAIMLTSPNYYGMIPPELSPIIQLCQEHDCIVLVDEAHGAHFGQHPSLPPSGMQLGADASVQSTHKMLSSMTMTSMLHIQGNRVEREDVEYYLASLQSSSPSYPLLASLDLARNFVQNLSSSDWENMLQNILELRQKLSEIPGVILSPVERKDGQYTSDPFKLTIQLEQSLSGYGLRDLLEEEQIYVELADSHNILLTLPLQSEEEWKTRLVQALKRIVQENRYNKESRHKLTKEIEGTKEKSSKKESLQLEGELVYGKKKIKTLQIRKYKKKDVEIISLDRAVDRRAAEMLIPYPPGIPICLPNELITEELLEDIYRLQQQGAYFQGKPVDFNSLLVVKQGIQYNE
ncbi:aminotransferase class I/II-fold pyridoxal phosphate-dependent enzyme [Bacillus horti]|uniref:Arginine/lysine/ornithine decarboxylase n=1 Tax=Caldalkalibacillus horti TaxID=77523 RepID=A0ABT9W358_9BACI|nr:aminotransferase class I/II-fold pyridoxal phosphate-dependent enzyme [Bacillus horti]MDQ0167555.1 arginine/lysine/ornithine decarboxylase [Bacillus horti]